MPPTNPDASETRRRAWKLLVALSFVPLLVKAAGYATIGSYLPLFVFLAFLALVASGASIGPRAGALAVRIWASALVLWGIVRLGLIGVFKTTDIGEVHPVDQITLWYVALSVGHLILGVVLFRRCRHAGRPVRPAVAPR